MRGKTVSLLSMQPSERMTKSSSCVDQVGPQAILLLVFVLCICLLGGIESWRSSSFYFVFATARQLRGNWNTFEIASSLHDYRQVNVTSTFESKHSKNPKVTFESSRDKRRANAAVSESNHRKIPVATVEVPLFAKSGTHHVQIFVGHPPVPQTLIIDTGSRLTSLLCHDESNRSRRRYRYDPANSTTVQTIACGECRFTGDSRCGTIESSANSGSAESRASQEKYCIVKQHYTEGSSWTAYEVHDILSLSAVKNKRRQMERVTYEDSLETTIPFTFGCQTKVTGLFKRQFAHGILGLERCSHQSLPVQLYRHGVTHSTAFSLCLSSTAGSLGLGGALLSKHLEPMQLTTLLQNRIKSSHNNKTIASGMYTVTVEEVWLGETCLVSAVRNPRQLQAFSAGKGTILDSGTTDTFLPAALQDVFDAAWLEQTGKAVNQHRRDASYSIAEFLALPALHFVFEGAATLSVPAAHYMEGAAVFASYTAQNSTSYNKEVRHILQNRVYTNEPVGAVLGINSMLGYDILYDTDMGKIGFAKANC